jgi:hypothetical protein
MPQPIAPLICFVATLPFVAAQPFQPAPPLDAARSPQTIQTPLSPPIAVPLHAPSDVLDLGLMTISSSLSYFTGQTVRVTNVRVDEVLSPRVFIVEPANMPPSRNWHMDSRALVVLGAPMATAPSRGAVVEIVGQAWSLYEARTQRDQPALQDVKKHHLRRFEYKPVIHADLVRTPGGVELYSSTR